MIIKVALGPRTSISRILRVTVDQPNYSYMQAQNYMAGGFLRLIRINSRLPYTVIHERIIQDRIELPKGAGSMLTQ